MPASQRVLKALTDARSRLESVERARTEPIAVVGIGCRFPGGADDGASFWRLLRNGVDAVAEIPADRLDPSAYYDPRPGTPGKVYTRHAALLDAIDQFDPQFFGISPREASSLDPQQRLLLEVAWEALENAALAPDRLHGSRTGVYVGIGQNDYGYLQIESRNPAAIDAYFGTGNGLCYSPGRLSHLLGLRGPSMAIDTACSSSLVAVHLACQSLRTGECDLALAGGSHIFLSPHVAITLSMIKALAPDGRCKTFDESANGFGRGEGCGIVVLKRLSDAQDNGDNVMALIRGSAINHDGLSSGLTVPNETAQHEVLCQALANARVSADQIGYVEAHGTGTPLGDPIEVAALAAVLADKRPGDRPLMIGSVKTNIGHLEAAAGIAGLIKVVLSLHHRHVPPHLHFRQPSSKIPWRQLPISVPTELTPWPGKDAPRMAGVSAFGMSGSNAHVILQEAPAPVMPPDDRERPLHVITVAAKSEPAFKEIARRYQQHLAVGAELRLADVAFSANTGRAHFEFRGSVVADSPTQAIRGLTELADRDGGSAANGANEPDGVDIAFLFSGQGSQYAGMGKQLYETHPGFRESLDRCDRLLRPHLGRSLMEVMFATSASNRELLDETAYTQPALFALEYALAELWQSWGLQPRVVFGHSIGEYVAACRAGVFELEDGLRLVAERARLMQNMVERGAMFSVLADEPTVAAAIAPYSDDVAIAAVNGPQHVVISGLERHVQSVVADLHAASIKTRKLRVSHAFHSPLMQPMVDDFIKVASSVAYSEPSLPLVSNLDGRLATAQIATAEYWLKQALQPVRFCDAVQTIERRGPSVFVEIGPTTTLLGMAADCLVNESALLLPSLRKGRGDWQQMLDTLRQLYDIGAHIDWEGFDRCYARRRVALPTYPFQRQRYWLQSIAAPAVPNREVGELSYQIAWREKPLASDESQSRQRTDGAGQYLLLAGRDALATEIATQLSDRGDRALFVYAGERFSRQSSTQWTVNPTEQDDFSRLLRGIPRDLPLRACIHVWSCEPESDVEPTVATLSIAQTVGCGGLMHLTQAIAAAESEPSPVWLVTRGSAAAESVTPQNNGIANAAIRGFAKVIALEHPELWGGMIDFAGRTVAEEATHLLAEIDRADGEDQIVVRGDKRLVARLQSKTEPPCPPPPSLRGDATYLITGGLGSLGLRVARWMVGQGARHLVLVGRRGPDTSAANAVDQLRIQGTTVVTARADVAEEAEMAKVLAEIRQSLPPLAGVLHAAGVSGFQTIAELDWPAVENVLRPKVQGGWVLHRLTRDVELDWFLCFSSIASVWGGRGQSHYAAANHFLDVLARHRRALGLAGTSINWGPWDGGGMASAESRGWLEQMGVRSLPEDAALAALQRSLQSGELQRIVADIDWGRFKPFYEARGKRPLLELIASPPDVAAEAEQASEPSRLRTELEQAPPGQRREWLVCYLKEEVAAVLRLDNAQAIDSRKGFFKLGMDSLMAVELRNRLAAGLVAPLPATIAFDCPTIAGLAEFLMRDILHWETAKVEAVPSANHSGEFASSPHIDRLADEALDASIAARLVNLESLIRES